MLINNNNNNKNTGYFFCEQTRFKPPILGFMDSTPAADPQLPLVLQSLCDTVEELHHLFSKN